MTTSELTYVGPPIDDPDTLAALPADLRALLERRNGWIAFGGGLHVRGACRGPRWHSLGWWWRGGDALHRLFAAVESDDVPFAQDALGDQYLLRGGEVLRLAAELGELQPLGIGLTDFLDAAERDPEGFLSLEPLYHFLDEGGVLRPGELLSVYPPFVAAESRNGVSIRPISAQERIRFLATLAKAVAGHDDGDRLRLDATEQ
jgi:hypothetical protein